MNCDEVLLLGGAGFIGNALATRLAHEGAGVHVLGRHDHGRLEDGLARCGTVIHLACTTTPGSSASQPHLELANLAVTLRLLELLEAHPQCHLIFFSSGGTVYGNPQRLPVAEDALIAPLSNHGAGKAAQEAFCQVFRDKGHRVTILRPSNAYGPGQAVRAGFGLVRTMLEHVRIGTNMEVWGDGEIVRDYVYIDDIVEATVRLIHGSKDSGTYNLGSGVGYSVNQMKDIVEQVTGRRLKTTSHPARDIDVQRVVLDMALLEEKINWRPLVNLPDGVARTWDWMQST